MFLSFRLKLTTDDRSGSHDLLTKRVLIVLNKSIESAVCPAALLRGSDTCLALSEVKPLSGVRNIIRSADCPIPTAQNLTPAIPLGSGSVIQHQ